MKEIEEQRYGRNKDTVVDKGYLESGKFRRKFDGISDDTKLNRLLFYLAKKMLIHRSGTRFEDMYWIDPEKHKVVAQEIDGKCEKQIVYSERTKAVILENTGLVTIHSHPDSYPPSIEDLNSNYVNDYKLGIVVTHSGRVYVYRNFNYISERYYQLKVDGYLKAGYNEDESQIKALCYCREHFDVEFMEVTEND